MSGIGLRNFPTMVPLKVDPSLGGILPVFWSGFDGSILGRLQSAPSSIVWLMRCRANTKLFLDGGAFAATAIDNCVLEFGRRLIGFWNKAQTDCSLSLFLWHGFPDFAISRANFFIFSEGLLLHLWQENPKDRWINWCAADHTSL